MEVIEVKAEDSRSLHRQLYPILVQRVFHSTNSSGYQGIIEEGAILSARDNDIKRRWENAKSLFFERGYVSFWDFFHPTCKSIRDNIWKQTFYRHGRERDTFFLMLKPEYYSKLKTWDEIPLEEWLGKQIVPHIESGLKAPVPMAWIDGIVKVTLWDEVHPWFQQPFDEEV